MFVNHLLVWIAKILEANSHEKHCREAIIIRIREESFPNIVQTFTNIFLMALNVNHSINDVSFNWCYVLIFSAILLPSVGWRKCAVTPSNKWFHYYQQTWFRQPSEPTEVCVVTQLRGPSIRCDADAPSTLELIFNQKAHLVGHPRDEPSHLVRRWQSELTKYESILLFNAQ